MDIDIEIKDGFTHAQPIGRLDSISCTAFDEKMKTLMVPGMKLLLQFSKVDYISSSGLRSLVILEKMIQESGGTLSVFGLTPMVQQVFEISGFDTLLKVFSKEQEAVDYLLKA